jgi:hypothetical protein
MIYIKLLFINCSFMSIISYYFYYKIKNLEKEIEYNKTEIDRQYNLINNLLDEMNNYNSYLLNL